MKFPGVRFVSLFAVVLSVARTADAQKKEPDHQVVPPPAVSAEEAIKTVQEAFKEFVIGEGWKKEGKRGETRLEVSLLYRGRAFARVSVDAVGEKILPKGVPASVAGADLPVEKAARIVRVRFKDFRIGTYTWLGKRGTVWEVPLILGKTVVTTLKVDSQSGRLVADEGVERDYRKYVKKPEAKPGVKRK